MIYFMSSLEEHG